MKLTLVLLFSLVFASDALAISVEGLIKRYGKRTVMETIADKLHNKFTVFVDAVAGSTEIVTAPSPDYITDVTLAIDIERAGMTASTVEAALLGDIEKKKQQEKDRAELAAWGREQAAKDEEKARRISAHELSSQTPPTEYLQSIEWALKRILYDPYSAHIESISKPKPR